MNVAILPPLKILIILASFCQNGALYNYKLLYAFIAIGSPMANLRRDVFAESAVGGCPSDKPEVENVTLCFQRGWRLRRRAAWIGNLGSFSPRGETARNSPAAFQFDHGAAVHPARNALDNHVAADIAGTAVTRACWRLAFVPHRRLEWQICVATALVAHSDPCSVTV
jgi:hypothetical protein